MGRKQQGRKVANSSLGRALVNKKRNKKLNKNKQYAGRHLTNIEDDNGAGKLESVIQRNDLDEFLCNALLEEREFVAEKQNIIVVKGPTTLVKNVNNEENQVNNEIPKSLPIPHRPKWDSNMSKDELNHNETEAFLEWRRKLALIEEQSGNVLTPFEKNLEVWRQLWRVIERSDIVVQIVDGRHPLLYRCNDLEDYANSMNKKCLLVINKADYLTSWQRKAWGDYLVSENIEFAFFSAIESCDENISIDNSNQYEKDDDNYPILTVSSLLEFFTNNCETKTNDELVTIGMVGYPNVGKSSTINAILGTKKVSVSATPGKTKHFQTLMITDKICLCDCPGLVFPSLLHSHSELVLSGVIPLAHLRDHQAPMNLLVTRIPNIQLKQVYNLNFPDSSYTSYALLDAHARMRGFMKDHGRPDESRSARIILKDYVIGKLLYCHPPPFLNVNMHEDFLKATKLKVIDKASPSIELIQQQLDEQFRKNAEDDEKIKMLKYEYNFDHQKSPIKQQLTKKQLRRQHQKEKRNRNTKARNRFKKGTSAHTSTVYGVNS